MPPKQGTRLKRVPCMDFAHRAIAAQETGSYLLTRGEQIYQRGPIISAKFVPAGTSFRGFKLNVIGLTLNLCLFFDITHTDTHTHAEIAI